MSRRRRRPAMTAEGLLCLQFLGTGRNDPRMRAGADYLLQHLPHADGRETSLLLVLRHAGHVPHAGRLLEGLERADARSGREDPGDRGANAGTWDPRDAYEQRAGRLYATSLRLLILEVYYRHLPLYDQLSQ